MKIETRIFGQIDIDNNKIITLEKGMIGFPELTRFALIYDKEKKDKGFQISWLQSMDDGDIAFPVTDPFYVMKEYNPSVSEEILAPLGELTEENVYVLVTVTVPKKVEDFSVNLKAPIACPYKELQTSLLEVALRLALFFWNVLTKKMPYFIGAQYVVLTLKFYQFEIILYV